MGTLLSIIIPTKNRYEYLIEVLKILCSFKSEEFEIVVQDNSDEGKNRDSFINFLVEFDDKRIKYFYNTCHLSINENSDKAILNSCGKYVCFIGDDDCVASHIIQAVKWMDTESIEVLTFHSPVYIWPDVDFKYLGKKHTGILYCKEPHASVEIKNPFDELVKLLKSGGQLLSDMPLLYHGVVLRSVLNKIFEVTGSYFPGSVPDMDVAVCLSLYSSKFYKIDVPIVVSGTARKSAGGLGAAKLHKGDIRKISTLPIDTADKWNPLNPFFWSGPTIYADSIYKCLVRTGKSDLLNMFNYEYLYAELLVFNSDYFSEILRTIKANKKASYVRISFYALERLLLRTKFFIMNRLPFFPHHTNHQFDFLNITDAMKHVEQVLNKVDLPWGRISNV